ncbi:unnamed protein product, partial [Polarella glacialis]
MSVLLSRRLQRCNHEIGKCTSSVPSTLRTPEKPPLMAPTTPPEVMVQDMEHRHFRQGEALRQARAGFADSAATESQVHVALAKAKAQQWIPTSTILTALSHSLRIEPDVVSFSATAAACKRGPHWAMALRLFASSRQHGLRPNSVTAGTAIGACSWARQWALALALLHSLRCSSQQLDVATFTTALSAMSSSSLWERALQLPCEIRSRSIEVDAPLWGGAASACERGRRWEQALMLLPEVFSSATQGSPSLASALPALNAVLSACEAGRRWREALDLLSVKARLLRLRPNTISYGSAISACEKAARWS